MTNERRPVIYIVEDDDSIRELLSFNLENENYEVRAFARAGTLLEAVRVLPTDEFISLFLLDIMLPDMDGYEILRHLRRDPRFELSSFLMLTALSSEKNKLEGLDLGADDYITKPFGMRELLARVRRLIARTDQRLCLIGEREATASDQTTSQLRHGPLLLQPESRRLFIKGQEVETTRLEFDLLLFLMRHPGQVMTRDQILQHVWGFDFEGETRTVDVHVRNLRRKCEEAGLTAQVIDTVRGIGYRLNEVIQDA